MKACLLALTMGLGISFNAVCTTRYVDLNSPTPFPPFTNWATAAKVIQDAVDYSTTGDLVLVTNGVYQTGGMALPNTITNRVAVTNKIVLQSANGPAVTLISGHQIPGVTNGDAAIRCVYLDNGAAIHGFTLTNGASGVSYDPDGGGLYCASGSEVVSNCVVIGNSAEGRGGGGFGGNFFSTQFAKNSASGGGGYSGNGVISNCTFVANLAYYSAGGCSGGNERPKVFRSLFLSNSVPSRYADGGTAANNATLTDCVIIGNQGGDGRGAVVVCVLTNCTLRWNVNSGYGGAAESSLLYNCKLIENVALWGGGASFSQLYNCTVVGNRAYDVGGIGSCAAYNSIIYYNSDEASSDTDSPDFGGGLLSFDHCCVASRWPFPIENITNAPLFVDYAGWNLRLQSNSPCINAGTNSPDIGEVDLDGRPRIVGGTVDIGAYEYQGPGMGEFIGWMEQFGLSTDGSTDSGDGDGDGGNNWQEWIAGTDPTNAVSVLKLLAPTSGVSGVSVTWQSVSNRNYWLERATNHASPPAFSVIAANLPGADGMNTFLDVDVSGSGPFLYRVGVR